MNHVWLIGFMGAGKTTVGALLGDLLEMRTIDVDEVISHKAGRSVAEVFREDGEAAFRDLERAAVEELAAQDPAVISCGGGAAADERNRAVMSSTGTVVYLQVTPEEALARVGDTGSRPLLHGDALSAARSLLEARVALYEALADVVVDTVGLKPEQVADTTARMLAEAGLEGGVA